MGILSPVGGVLTGSPYVHSIATLSETTLYTPAVVLALAD